MNIHEMDDKEVTKEDIEKIKSSKCVYCKKDYSKEPILCCDFGKGLIWWHEEHEDSNDVYD